ncbi:MAG: tRNA (adenine-N1)-methyltransferase [Sulfolobales archaeon]
MTPVLNPDSEKFVNEGDLILLYIDQRRKYVLKTSSQARFGSDRGYIDHRNIIGRIYGSAVETSVGFRAYILKPTLEDLAYKIFKRPTQVLYPKDLGLILLKLDVSPGKRFLEAGVGSGVATAFLARSVAPNGKIYGYEIREDLAQIAIENLRKLGLDPYVEIKIRDIAEGVDEKDLDGALIDLPDPWRVTESVYTALRESAPVVFFIPTINQLNKLIDALLSEEKWIDISAHEILERRYEIKKESVRPSTRMIGHTGYIVCARKILKGER